MKNWKTSANFERLNPKCGGSLIFLEVAKSEPWRPEPSELLGFTCQKVGRSTGWLCECCAVEGAMLCHGRQGLGLILSFSFTGYFSSSPSGSSCQIKALIHIDILWGPNEQQIQECLEFCQFIVNEQKCQCFSQAPFWVFKHHNSG